MYSLYEVPVSTLKDIPVVQRVHTLVSESCSDLWANYTSTNVQIYLCHCRQRGQGLLMSKTEIKKQTRTREKETWPNKKLRLSQITTPAMSLLPWQSVWPWVSHMAFFIAVRPQLDPGLTAATLSGGRLDQSSHLKRINKEGRNQKLMRRLPGHIQRRQGVELRPHRHMAGWSAPEAEPKEGRGYRVGENRGEGAGEQSRCRVPVRQNRRAERAGHSPENRLLPRSAPVWAHVCPDRQTQWNPFSQGALGDHQSLFSTTGPSSVPVPVISAKVNEKLTNMPCS